MIQMLKSIPFTYTSLRYTDTPVYKHNQTHTFRFTIFLSSKLHEKISNIALYSLNQNYRYQNVHTITYNYRCQNAHTIPYTTYMILITPAKENTLSCPTKLIRHDLQDKTLFLKLHSSE